MKETRGEMHELSVCNALLDQVASLMTQHGATGVSAVTLRLGPLSGVEPVLLRAAFMQSRTGTFAGDADLVIVAAPVRVECRACGTWGDAAANRLTCGTCGGADTRLAGGDEMLLDSVDFIFEA